MKRRLVSTTLILTLAGLLATGLVFSGAVKTADVHAQSPAEANSLCPGNCSEALIKGCYAIELEGWQGTGAGRVPFALVGFYSADGKGNLSGVGTVSVDGVISPVAVTATYVVDPDTCTGTAASNIGTFSFTIADGGKEVRSISTTPGLTVHGVARRQVGS